MVHQILAATSASVSELKKNPMGAVAAGEGFPVAILNRNEPVFYCVPAKAYEAMLDRLEDLELNAIADARGMEKIKTHGDGYLAAAGLPVAAADHASRAALMALDMLDAIRSFHDHSPHRLEIRIGIDTGSVVAGVIGKRKFMYDLWGNVVNNAHQMEACALPGHIHVTDVTRIRLGDDFAVEDWTSDEPDAAPQALSWYVTGAAAAS